MVIKYSVVESKYHLIDGKRILMRRLKALRNFGLVTMGDISGWICENSTIGTMDNSWVHRNSRLFNSHVREVIVRGKTDIVDSRIEALNTSIIHGKDSVIRSSEISAEKMDITGSFDIRESGILSRNLKMHTDDASVIQLWRSTGRNDISIIAEKLNTKAKPGILCVYDCHLSKSTLYQCRDTRNREDIECKIEFCVFVDSEMSRYKFTSMMNLSFRGARIGSDSDYVTIGNVDGRDGLVIIHRGKYGPTMSYSGSSYVPDKFKEKLAAITEHDTNMLFTVNKMIDTAIEVFK